MAEEQIHEWSITALAASAGVTTRTLRHYDAIGLLPPSSVSASGHRHYDEQAVLRLQQILAYRELGMPLPDIAATLDELRDSRETLQQLEQALTGRIERQQRQRASIRRVLAAHDTKEALMPEEILDGFDHTDHRKEVEQRWGKDAYASSDQWWRGMTEVERLGWRQASDQLLADWRAAADAGIAPESATAQALAERQSKWLSSIPGTPGAGSGAADPEYLLGLADLYVDDERFAANYGGRQGAAFVREALRAHVAGLG